MSLRSILMTAPSTGLPFSSVTLPTLVYVVCANRPNARRKRTVQAPTGAHFEINLAIDVKRPPLSRILQERVNATATVRVAARAGRAGLKMRVEHLLNAGLPDSSDALF